MLLASQALLLGFRFALLAARLLDLPAPLGAQLLQPLALGLFQLAALALFGGNAGERCVQILAKGGKLDLGGRIAVLRIVQQGLQRRQLRAQGGDLLVQQGGAALAFV